jgi:hypothetical protein
MKNLVLTLITLWALLSLSTTQAKTPKNYLHQLAKAGHVALDYSEVKKILFFTVENTGGEVCSVYTENQCQKRHYKPYPYPPKKSKALKYKKPRGFKLNIEHTWPQSKGAKELPANSDMHHLFVTSKESNSKRANLPFCNVASEFWEFGGSLMGIDIYAQDCFEPRDIHKGNVARAMFYFSVRYQMQIDADQEVVLRQWHKDDPVDSQEIKRNELIGIIQGNTNPFIEKPSYVDDISDF